MFSSQHQYNLESAKSDTKLLQKQFLHEFVVNHKIIPYRIIESKGYTLCQRTKTAFWNSAGVLRLAGFLITGLPNRITFHHSTPSHMQ